jgi:hypothetical protein
MALAEEYLRISHAATKYGYFRSNFITHIHPEMPEAQLMIVSVLMLV